jgi:hypothetical protein
LGKIAEWSEAERSNFDLFDFFPPREAGTAKGEVKTAKSYQKSYQFLVNTNKY